MNCHLCDARQPWFAGWLAVFPPPGIAFHYEIAPVPSQDAARCVLEDISAALRLLASLGIKLPFKVAVAAPRGLSRDAELAALMRAQLEEMLNLAWRLEIRFTYSEAC